MIAQVDIDVKLIWEDNCDDPLRHNIRSAHVTNKTHIKDKADWNTLLDYYNMSRGEGRLQFVHVIQTKPFP